MLESHTDNLELRTNVSKEDMEDVMVDKQLFVTSRLICVQYHIASIYNLTSVNYLHIDMLWGPTELDRTEAT